MKLKSIILNDHAKPAVYPNALDELREAWRLLGFTHAQPVIVIVGGAGGMSEEHIARVQEFFEKHLIPFAQSKKAVIIEGGTDSGVMAAIGRARHLTGSDVPLVGVLARDVDMIMTMLEPHHTHFIFCPGSNWGDESEWIAASASALAGSQPSVAIMINGGAITWTDAHFNIQYGRAVVIAEGSGRAADVIATTSIGRALDPQALAILRTGRAYVANFFKEPKKFIEKLNDLMK